MEGVHSIIYVVKRNSTAVPSRTFLTTLIFNIILFSTNNKYLSYLYSKTLWSTPSSAIDVALDFANPLDVNDVGKYNDMMMMMMICTLHPAASSIKTTTYPLIAFCVCVSFLNVMFTPLFTLTRIYIL